MLDRARLDEVVLVEAVLVEVLPAYARPIGIALISAVFLATVPAGIPLAAHRRSPPFSQSIFSAASRPRCAAA